MAQAAQQSNSKPGICIGNKKKGMKRIKTVWVTEPSVPIDEDFKIGSQIGEPGQFGVAFKCTRKKDDVVFVVKKIDKARLYRVDRSQRKREALLRAMQGEIDIMRTLKHKYIVNMDSVYEDKHTLWIVMEECKGGELFDRIRERARYSEEDAAPIIKMICEALYYMHGTHRVVHCDLKPDNILFVNSDKDSDLKIIDFGMSKVLPRLRSLNELCGTPYYTAPEVIDGDYAHGADMWSVGVILFVMLFGFPPFYVDPQKYFGQKEARAIYKLIKQGFIPKVKKGHGAWFPSKMPVSEEARDFMSHLMDSNRANRLTAREALQHPWIVNLGPAPKVNKITKIAQKISSMTSNKDTSDEKETMNKEIIETFASFGQSQRFKYAMAALFRDQFKKMRPSHFHSLKKLFKTLDSDGNGKISLQEFESGILNMSEINLNKQQIEAMFNELDTNNFGEIAFEEFLNAAVHDYLVANDQRLYEIFRELDSDDDGRIKLEEIESKLKELKLYDHIDEMLKILKETDTNGDGVIDYEEFLHALHPDFNEPPEWFWDIKAVVNDNNNNDVNNSNDNNSNDNNTAVKPANEAVDESKNDV